MSKQQSPIDLDSLRGKVAIITGAGNGGIGWGLCCHAAGQLGMHVVAVDLHENLVRDAEIQLMEAFPDVTSIGIQADVTDPTSLAVCLEIIQRSLPGHEIGAVFANAGVIFNHTILRSTAREWATTLNVNVLGVVNTIQAFVPVLQAQQSQSVFSATASVGGLVRGDGGAAAYQASKHAVVAISEALSFELARKSPQIHVHVLCPCIVQSALHQTSKLNAAVADGKLSASEIDATRIPASSLAMDTASHAQQVFDHIAQGNFYMITENVRPYVDHDFPFDANGIIRERYENMLNLQLDNGDAWETGPSGSPSAILKGPLFQEAKRRATPE